MLDALLRWLYSQALRLLTPAYLLRLWWKGRKEPVYRKRLGERLGRYPFKPRRDRGGVVWIHAVSLGETRAAGPLIKALRGQLPGMRLLLTCSTATGVHAGLELLEREDDQAWLPYDTPGAVRRFLKRYRPAVGVIMETEVWPNLMARAQTLQIPMVLANARLSIKSQRKGRRFARLLVPALSAFTRVLAQTARDAQRFRELGARAVEVCGNTKFDLTPPPKLLVRGHEWRARLNRPVVLMASSREGEEENVFDEWRALPQPRPLLVVVPRHAPRFDDVAEMAQQAGLAFARRSSWSEEPPAEAAALDVLDRRLDRRDAAVLRAGRRGAAGRQLRATRRPEPDRGRGLRLPAADGPAHLQLRGSGGSGHRGRRRGAHEGHGQRGAARGRAGGRPAPQRVGRAGVVVRHLAPRRQRAHGAAHRDADDGAGLGAMSAVRGRMRRHDAAVAVTAEAGAGPSRRAWPTTALLGLAFAALLLVAALLAAFVVARWGAEDEAAAAERALQARVQSDVAALTTLIEQRLALLAAVAAHPQWHAALGDEAARPEAVAAIGRVWADAPSIAWIDDRGRVVIGGGDLRVGDNVSDRRWFDAAARGALVSDEAGIVRVVAPLHDATRRTGGVLSVVIDCAELDRRLGAVVASPSSWGLIGRQGEVLCAHAALPRSLAQTATPSEAEWVSAPGSGALLLAGQRIAAPPVVAAPGWRVLRAQSADAALPRARDRSARALAAMSLAGALLLPLVWLLAQRLARPLRELAAALNEVRVRYDYDPRRIPVQGTREAVAVGEAARAMLAQIATQQALVDDSATGYRELFELHPLPMWVVDEETLRFLEVNDAALRKYGWRRDEFLAMTVLDVPTGASARGGGRGDRRPAHAG